MSYLHALLPLLYDRDLPPTMSSERDKIPEKGADVTRDALGGLLGV